MSRYKKQSSLYSWKLRKIDDQDLDEGENYSDVLDLISLKLFF